MTLNYTARRLPMSLLTQIGVALTFTSALLSSAGFVLVFFRGPIFKRSQFPPMPGEWAIPAAGIPEAIAFSAVFICSACVVLAGIPAAVESFRQSRRRLLGCLLGLILASIAEIAMLALLTLG